MNKNFKYWLSWIGVVPISLIAGALVTFPLHWILYSTLSGGDDPFITTYPELPEKMLHPFFTALIIIWVASLIAPQYKLKTALIIATLYIFVAGGAFVLGYLNYRSGNLQVSLTAGGLPVLMGLAGAIVGLYIVKNNLLEKHTKRN
jgi:hypothetical protein